MPFLPQYIYSRLKRDMAISCQDECFLIEVNSLTSDGRECFASNKHFTTIIKAGESRVKQVVAKLKRNGFLVATGAGFKRRLTLTEKALWYMSNEEPEPDWVPIQASPEPERKPAKPKGQPKAERKPAPAKPKSDTSNHERAAQIAEAIDLVPEADLIREAWAKWVRVKAARDRAITVEGFQALLGKLRRECRNKSAVALRTLNEAADAKLTYLKPFFDEEPTTSSNPFGGVVR